MSADSGPSQHDQLGDRRSRSPSFDGRSVCWTSRWSRWPSQLRGDRLREQVVLHTPRRSTTSRRPQDAIAKDEYALTADTQALDGSTMTSPVAGKVLAVNGLVGESVGLNAGVHSSNGGAVPGSNGNGAGGPSTYQRRYHDTGLHHDRRGTRPSGRPPLQVPCDLLDPLGQERRGCDDLGSMPSAARASSGHVMVVEPTPVVVSGQDVLRRDHRAEHRARPGRFHAAAGK